jgi:hypothetical protein
MEDKTRRQIESAVAAVAPEDWLSSGRRPRVTITTFDDPPPSAGQSAGWNLSGWLAHTWPVLGTVLLSLLAGSFMAGHRWRGTGKCGARTGIPPSLKVVTEPSSASSEQLRPSEAGSAVQHPLREQLRHLVERDPDAAARAMNQWIDKAG